MRDFWKWFSKQISGFGVVDEFAEEVSMGIRKVNSWLTTLRLGTKARATLIVGD